jgi:hypothetical protein
LSISLAENRRGLREFYRHRRSSRPQARSRLGGKIAPGFKSNRALDMKFLGGRAIPNLSFQSFYLAASGWSDSDIQNIDNPLSGAMSDPNLNHVLQQYFPGSNPITTTLIGSTKVSDSVKKTYTRDDANPTLEALMDNGNLNGVKAHLLTLKPKAAPADSYRSVGTRPVRNRASI